MDYIKQVEDLLTDYNRYKREIAVLKQVGGEFVQIDRKIKFLEFCLSLLEPYQKEIILSVCIKGISIRKYANSTGLSRNFISNEKQKIINDLGRYFEIKYESEKSQ